MPLKEELEVEVAKVFSVQWQKRNGSVVPEAEDLGLGNESVIIDGTVLYADLAASTKMVDNYQRHFAAEVNKAYLHCAAKLIRSEKGTITAYDGDRIMGIFVGSSKDSSAVRCGLRINWAVKNIVNPAIKGQYPSKDFAVRHVVGIDTTSDIWASRTGVRGANDLVWVGRAANYAAKLTELDADYPTWITKSVYDQIDDSLKFNKGQAIWDPMIWNTMNKMSIYRSNWLMAS